MTTGQQSEVLEPATEVAVKLVDCDVHPEPSSPQELRSYFPGWAKDMPESLMANTSLYLPPKHAARLDAIGPCGEKAGSDPAFMEQQLLVEAGVDFAILDPLVRPQKDLRYEQVLSQATNDWLADRWLSRGHDRFKGSIRVSAADPKAAVAEIERWAGHPGFVQVWLDMYAEVPYGDRRYEPIFEAATQAGLPMAMHFAKGTGQTLSTPVGWSSYYFEHHSLYPMGFAAHVISLICQGTFDRVPGLRFVFIEGGCGWMLPLLWRLERHWDAMAHDHPEARRRPWDYVREHMRWTTQPIEEPSRRHLELTLDLMEADRLLMFSTDYPHWDYDDPSDVIRRLPEQHQQRIFATNALEFYGLPSHRAVDRLDTNG